MYQSKVIDKSRIYESQAQADAAMMLLRDQIVKLAQAAGVRVFTGAIGIAHAGDGNEEFASLSTLCFSLGIGDGFKYLTPDLLQHCNQVLASTSTEESTDAQSET